MNVWAALYKAHGQMREPVQRIDLVGELRSRLVQLADLGSCAPSVRHRFTYKKSTDGGVREFYIRPESDRLRAEPIKVVGMRKAHLVVQATIDIRTGRAHEFSAAVSGRTRAGFKWTVAVHLDDDRGLSTVGLNPDQKGAGACSHAVFHCHVGPDLDAKPKVRVPLPAVGPAAALDWLLATVVPQFEPLPWPRANELIVRAEP